MGHWLVTVTPVSLSTERIGVGEWEKEKYMLWQSRTTKPSASDTVRRIWTPGERDSEFQRKGKEVRRDLLTRRLTRLRRVISNFQWHRDSIWRSISSLLLEYTGKFKNSPHHRQKEVLKRLVSIRFLILGETVELVSLAISGKYPLHEPSRHFHYVSNFLCFGCRSYAIPLANIKSHNTYSQASDIDQVKNREGR